MADRHTPKSMSDWTKYLSHGEIDLLTQLALALPADPVVVNIGAGSGTSGLTFLSARDDLQLYTIDVAYESNPYGGLMNEWGALEAAALVPSGRYLGIHGESIKVGQAWDRGPVDLVFVDGDHSYAGARGDIETWWALLQPGGCMAIHDYLKVESYARNHPGQPITDELIWREIKPYYDVDRAVADFFGMVQPEPAGHVDTLIAYRKGGE